MKELGLKSKLVLTAAVLTIVWESAACGPLKKQEADKDSSFISYHVYHFFHSVEGISRNVLCDAETDSSTHTIAIVSAEAGVNTFKSGNEARDESAMKAVDSDKYPEVTFQSDSIFFDSDTTARVKGKLMFHGVSNPVTIPITIKFRTGEMIVDGIINLNFDSFNVKRPALVFIPIGDDFTVAFHFSFHR